jgi:regulator of nucleoside diphosphate kinase
LQSSQSFPQAVATTASGRVDAPHLARSTRVGRKATTRTLGAVMPSKPTLSTVDFSRLMPFVAASDVRFTQAIVDQLDEKLANATLVAPETMRPDVVTMNSRVLLSSSVWEEPREYRLVYPREGTSEKGELSVLSLLGTKLLGAHTGARFALGSGPNLRLVELAAVTYQPEAAGDWDL